ncbi:hypothetical protein JYU34_005081 [Plutella xylostella]|uniref:Uncharacterized protein n=1 Tax=Plutella xylostella TaxID=51655 RepID=A0ABQ7QVV2_PLUXY|nr:hypothetical protein JYU34_005081 [Plutella xylostella]
MAAKSPVQRREVIGGEQFEQRREVFGQHDTVFLPPSPPVSPVYRAVEPIVTSAHGITTANFKRNGPAHSSMREPRAQPEFRARKYSDNYSDLDQSDDGDYRRSMTDRTRRLSKMRRDFLTSNLHDPSESPFARKGTRATLPSSIEFKLYKFPFAEPYATPTPVRKVRLELGPSDGVDAADKENDDPEAETTETKHQSLPVASNNNNATKIDHQKLFEELVKRYSPQRKPVDWTLPPTKPRVVGSVPKTRGASIDERIVNGDKDAETKDMLNGKHAIPAVKVNDESHDSTISITELAEKNDRVPELSTIQRQMSREDKRPHVDKSTDLSIPALIDKMTAEGQDLESHKNDKKKVKRKRSFIDKLLGRKKDIRSQ